MSSAQKLSNVVGGIVGGSRQPKDLADVGQIPPDDQVSPDEDDEVPKSEASFLEPREVKAMHLPAVDPSLSGLSVCQVCACRIRRLGRGRAWVMMKAREKPKPNMNAEDWFPLATVRSNVGRQTRQQPQPKRTVAALTEDCYED